MKTEIEILEPISRGELQIHDINRRLLELYPDKKRYFYHYSYRESSKHIITNDLIETSEDFFNMLKDKDKEEFDFHRMVSYDSVGDIPKDKKIIRILYEN
jgi:hypothetical protein